MESFQESTDAYLAWLRENLGERFDGAALAEKRDKMLGDSDSAFPYLRGSFYRWAQLWPENAGGLTAVTEVLAIGDSHVENFGTWRDAEGRLVWGANDFDEAAALPWTSDLVRLGLSAVLMLEAKARAPSAVEWVKGEEAKSDSILELLAKARRSPDPTYTVESDWVVRRQSPDAVKIQFADLEASPTDAMVALLRAMGAETANIHANRATAIQGDLAALDAADAGWFANAVQRFANLVKADFEEFKTASNPKS